MKLYKSKQYFWSQLLLSMIAIFAFPSAQGLEDNATKSNYPNEQYQTQKYQYTINLIEQARQHLLENTSPIFIKESTTNKVEPQFFILYSHYNAPIRAGPCFNA